MTPSTLSGPKAEVALLEELRQRCDGEVRKSTFSGKHGATEFKLRFLPKQQGFVVSVTTPLVGRFQVTRKSGLDRRMEGFVPAERFHARDERFDHDFNVSTRDVQVASAVLTRKPSRAAVRRIFERGSHAVSLVGDRVECTCSRKAFGAKPAVEDVLGSIEDLAVLADAVTDFAARRSLPPPKKSDPAVVAAWTSLIALGVLGLAMVIGGAVEFTPVLPARFLLPCALVGLPAVAPAVLGLVFLVKHRTAPYGLVRGLAGVSAIVVPLFVSGALLVSNGLFDGTSPEEHVVTVVGKNIKKNKNDVSYQAGLASWWTEGDVRWVNISKATYDVLVPHVSRMQVHTHPGKLGHAWIESYRVTP